MLTSVMHDPYDYQNTGAHWGVWIVMIVAMLVLAAILAWAVVSIVRHRDMHAAAGTSPTPGGIEALRILDERLARGDIDVEEYTRRRDLLRGGASPPPGPT